MEIALFGGSFNPPYIGHFLICKYILRVGLADSIYILPVFKHPLGKKLLEFKHRKRMCEILFHNVRDIRVKNWELYNESGRTINLLRWIFSQWSNTKFKLIIGSDCIGEKDKWKDFSKIEKNGRYYCCGPFNYG